MHHSSCCNVYSLILLRQSSILYVIPSVWCFILFPIIIIFTGYPIIWSVRLYIHSFPAKCMMQKSRDKFREVATRIIMDECLANWRLRIPSKYILKTYYLSWVWRNRQPSNLIHPHVSTDSLQGVGGGGAAKEGVRGGENALGRGQSLALKGVIMSPDQTEEKGATESSTRSHKTQSPLNQLIVTLFSGGEFGGVFCIQVCERSYIQYIVWRRVVLEGVNSYLKLKGSKTKGLRGVDKGAFGGRRVGLGGIRFVVQQVPWGEGGGSPWVAIFFPWTSYNPLLRR